MRIAILTAMAVTLYVENALADGWKLDADIDACLQSDTMAVQEMYDCLGKLVQSSNATLTATFEKAISGIDPVSKTKLVTAEDAFYSYWRLTVEANHGPWRQGTEHSSRELAAMVNAITSARERSNELFRLYVDRDQ
jgi:uncharacterized protein YecT (DUF1311 family)